MNRPPIDGIVHGRLGTQAMTPADLVEIELVKRLKYKYMRCLDQKRWDEIATCFTEDATCSYSGGKYAFQGRDAIVDFLRKAMGAPSFLSSVSFERSGVRTAMPFSTRAASAS